METHNRFEASVHCLFTRDFISKKKKQKTNVIVVVVVVVKDEDSTDGYQFLE